jgi:transposase
MSEIPTKLTREQFQEHIEPYLSAPQRGFHCRIPLYKVFNYILYWLHTGCQWAEVPIATLPGAEKKNSLLGRFITTFSSGATTVV